MRRFYEYEPVPFYFFNDEFNKEEVIKQLDVMSENGIKAFFLHVRDGVTTEPWGTERFFENMKFVVEQAIAKGITPWLYDEDSYPSGQAGGQIVIDRPELTSRGLKVVKVTKDEKTGRFSAYLGRVKGVCGYIVDKKDGKESVTVVENCFGPVRRRWYRRDMDKCYYADMADMRYNHIRAVTSYTETMFEVEAPDDAEVYCAYLKSSKTDSKYGVMADCYNIETTKEFIARVYEKYKEKLGKYFGKEIPGIFMDEPSSGEGLPYTGCLFDYFKARNGYDLREKLYTLSPDYTGDAAAVRRDYVSTVQNLFTENFIKPIGEWCKANNLKFTGHYCAEEDPLVQALGGQSVYVNAGFMGIPGFDVITTNIGDLKHPSLIVGGNLVASSAAQLGKERIMAESFALAPHNFGYDGLKRTSDWLFSCGINMIVPHGFHYGYNAYQRADAGKSFFFQDPLFNEYVEYSHYAGRACKLLCKYNRDNDILIVSPDGAFAEEVPFPIGNNGIAPSERAVKIRTRFFDAAKTLFTHHTGYDLTETDTALNAPIKDGKIIIGEKSYGTVIVVKGGDKEQSVYQAIKDKVNAVYFDGDASAIKTDDIVISGNAEKVLLYTKTNGKDKLHFFFNDSESYVKMQVRVPENAVVYDAEKDVCLKLQIKDGVAEISLQAYASIFIESAEQPFAQVEGVYVAEGDKRKTFECLTNPQLTYMPKGARKAINRYDITVSGNDGEKLYENVRADRIRNYYGTQDAVYKTEYTIPYMDTAPRRENVYPVTATYATEINCESKKDYLLFDGDSVVGNAEIYFNGKKIPKAEMKKHRVYDMKNYRIDPEWQDGANELRIVFDNADEFDGVNGEIYVMQE